MVRQNFDIITSMNRDINFLKLLAYNARDAIESLGLHYTIKHKPGRSNVVTEADLLSEKTIMDTVRKHFPNDQFLSEESANSVENPFDIEYLWIIDPIDGTNNFRYQRNYSAISIALAQKGILTDGVVYNFFTDEMYTASQGKGAYYNKTKIHTGQKTDIRDITIATDNSSNPEITARHLNTLLSIEPVPWTTMKGAAALELSEVAAGKIDVFFHSHINSWDIAAAMVIVREAGGVFKNFEGHDASFMDDHIIAGNEALVKKLLPIMKTANGGS